MVTLEGPGFEIECRCGYEAASMSAPVYPPAARTLPIECPTCGRTFGGVD